MGRHVIQQKEHALWSPTHKAKPRFAYLLGASLHSARLRVLERDYTAQEHFRLPSTCLLGTEHVPGNPPGPGGTAVSTCQAPFRDPGRCSEQKGCLRRAHT